MNDSKRQQILIYILLASAVAGGAMYLAQNKKRGKYIPPTSGRTIYYTGPMRNKAHPDTFTTDDGRVVPPPPDAAPPPKASSSPAGAGGGSSE